MGARVRLSDLGPRYRAEVEAQLGAPVDEERQVLGKLYRFRPEPVTPQQTQSMVAPDATKEPPILDESTMSTPPPMPAKPTHPRTFGRAVVDAFATPSTLAICQQWQELWRNRQQTTKMRRALQ